MFKKMSVLLVFILILTSSFTSFAAGASVDAIKGTPVIDGEIDKAWDSAKEISATKAIEGNGSFATAKVKVMWDKDNIYVLAVVTDPAVVAIAPEDWFQDAVEIFINGKNDADPALNADDVQLRVAATDAHMSGGGGGWIEDNMKTATKMTSTGYVMEASIGASGLGISDRMVNGSEIGFDVAVNDDPGTGKREGVTGWNDTSGNSWQSTAGYGTIKLVDPAATTTTTTTTSNNPKTGDNSSILVLAALLAISSAGFVVFRKSTATTKK